MFLKGISSQQGVGISHKTLFILCFRHLETFLKNDRLDLFELLTHIERWCTAYALISNFQCSHQENTK